MEIKYLNQLTACLVKALCFSLKHQVFYLSDHAVQWKTFTTLCLDSVFKGNKLCFRCGPLCVCVHKQDVHYLEPAGVVVAACLEIMNLFYFRLHPSVREAVPRGRLWALLSDLHYQVQMWLQD